MLFRKTIGGISMKRRLALLLTVILTAAAVPSAQLMAAETGTETTEMTQEDAPEEETPVIETEISDEDSASEEAEVIETAPEDTEVYEEDAEESAAPAEEEEADSVEEAAEDVSEADSAAEDMTVEEAAEAVTEQELPGPQSVGGRYPVPDRQPAGRRAGRMVRFSRGKRGS